MRSRGGIIVLLFLSTLGCRDEAPASSPETTIPDPGASQEDTVESEALEPSVEEEARPEVLDPDEMTEPELQAACYEGSQAACDRLGH